MNEEIEIRDRRNGQWAWVNNSVIADPHLTPAEKVTYMALATFAGYQEIKPSVPTLAARCSQSIRKVRIAIKRLEDIGYLQVERRNDYSPSIYHLLKAANGCNSCHTPGRKCTPANSAPRQKTAGDPGRKQHKTPAESAPTIDKEHIDNINISSPSVTPSIQESNFKLQSPSSNGHSKDADFLKIIERLIPFFIEKAVKRSYDLNSKPSGRNDSKKNRQQIILDSLKVLHQSIHAQRPEIDKAALMEETESAARFVVEEFCKSDWHMGRDPKTEGKKYDDMALYAFRDMATMEKYLKW